MLPRCSNCTAPFVHRDTGPYFSQPLTAASDVRAPLVMGRTLSQPQHPSVEVSVAVSGPPSAATISTQLKQQEKDVGQTQKQRRALGDRTNKVAAVSDPHSKSSSMDWDYAAESSFALTKTRQTQPKQQQREQPVALPSAAAIASRRAILSAVGEPLQYARTFPAAAIGTPAFLYPSINPRAVPMSTISSTFDPFGTYDLFDLHTPAAQGPGTEVDAAAPHLHITNIPPALDSRAIVDILKRYGDIKNVYDELLHLERQLTISFYDVRRTVLARQSLQAAAGSQIQGAHVGYMADPLLAACYNVPFEDSRASATVMVTMLGPGDRLVAFDYKALLMKWGDIRTDVQLELTKSRRTVQIEYFDQRCIPLVISNIHEQSFMNIHFHISLNTIVSGAIVPRHQAFESTLGALDKDGTGMSSTLAILPSEACPPLLQRPVQQPSRVIGQHLSAAPPVTPQDQHICPHTANASDGIVTAPSVLLGAYLPTQGPLSSLNTTVMISRRTHHDRGSSGYGNITSSEQTCYQAFPRASSDPGSVDTQISEDDERMASSSSTFTFVTAPSLSPREEPQTWTHVPSRSTGADNEFKLERIMNGRDTRTTFMIRNIPNKYTQAMLRECIDATNKGTYDFLYLRIDFQNRCNVGYAFINFIDVKSVSLFARERLGKRWNRFNSEKRCSLSYANIQGKKALMDKFRNSTVMEEDESYRPKIFYSEGPLKGEEETFPPPTAQSESRRHHRADGRRRRGPA